MYGYAVVGTVEDSVCSRLGLTGSFAMLLMSIILTIRMMILKSDGGTRVGKKGNYADYISAYQIICNPLLQLITQRVVIYFPTM